ncbi:hypothetical protein ACWD6X_05075 [Micrococcus luteus]
MFDAESRQSALSVSYGLGNAIWAGLSPVVATALFAATGTIWSVILLYMGMATLSMVCLVLAPQIRDNVFDVDHETPAAATVAR